MPKKRERSRFKNSLERANVGDSFVDVFPNEPAQIITIRKASPETVNNSATFQDDADFFFRVGVNEIWDVELVLIFDGNTTADFKWQWSLPSGGEFDGTAHVLQTAAATGADHRFVVVDETGSIAGGLTGNTAAYIRGLLVTGTVPGVAQFQWAQDTATAVDTILRARSFMTRRKVS